MDVCFAPLRKEHETHAKARFSITVLPPALTGLTWSIMEERLLSRLGESAILAAISGTLNDLAPQLRGHIHASRGPTTHATGTEPEQREAFTQLHQSFGFLLFSARQSSPLILFVEQEMKPFLDAFGQPKAREITRHFDFDLDGMRHTALSRP